MITWDVGLYSFVCGAMLMMSVLGLESATVTPSLSRWERHFFAAFFAALTICSAAFFLELVAFARPPLPGVQAIAYFLQSLFGAVAFPMLAVYLLHCCGEDWRRSALAHAVFILFAVFFVLLIVSPFTTVFCYIGPDNQFSFGPAYQLLVAPLLMMQLLIAAGVIRRRAKLSRQRYHAFLICLVPVTIAVIIHMFIVPAFTLIDASLTLSVYSAYRIIVSDSIERDQRHQREIASQRASIAVLQMRPHFIYNTMTTIYHLCDQNPELAKQVVANFTTYLRKNFAAVAGNEAVPFSEELEHARAYLAVEQAQYDDDLIVDYDIPHTCFCVPPLTLQPIVENAVKHGMDPDSVPLHIWVRTRETDLGSEVVVEDDGIGFDPAIADDPHTTLANIRQRLDMMCGGTMTVARREEGGTVVRVTVSRQK